RPRRAVESDAPETRPHQLADRARRRRSGGAGVMQHPSVLVVEDEAALLTLLRYNLEKEGFAVTEAHDGEEALMHLREGAPDAVLLDWMLPRVSGLEVCPKSAASRRGATCR